MEKVVVSGVTLNEDEAKVTLFGVPDKPGIAAKTFTDIASERINIDMIIQNVSESGLSDISFTVPRTAGAVFASSTSACVRLRAAS